jgi:hypothetical protein
MTWLVKLAETRGVRGDRGRAGTSGSLAGPAASP